MPKKGYISASQIDIMNYCRMRYYLKYVDPAKPKPLRLSAYVKGALLHEMIENFWLYLDPKIYSLDQDLSFRVSEFIQRQRRMKRPGKDKKGRPTSHWHKDKIKPKYDSPESFGKFAQGRWTGIIISSERTKTQERKIYWKGGYSDKSEAWEIRAQFPAISEALFKELIKEGPPSYSELEFEFELGGFSFYGFIDEVRLFEDEMKKTIFIRDYKSGSPWWVHEMKRDFDPQLTIYNAGICAKCFQDYEFAKSLKLEDICSTFMGNPLYVNPEFEEEFFMVEAPYLNALANRPKPLEPEMPEFIHQLNITSDEEKRLFKSYLKEYGEYKESVGVWRDKHRRLSLPKIIHSTKRTNEHFFALVHNIKTNKKEIESGDIPFESGKKCDLCDLRLTCAERIKHMGKPTFFKDNKGNKLFDFMSHPYTKPLELFPEQHKKIIHQKIFSWTKKDPREGRFKKQ